MTIIRETVQTMRRRDIGRLEHALRLPTAARIKCGMKTVCKACHQNITDEFFVVGFKTGMHNMLFHESCLTPDDLPEKGFSE